MSKKPLRVAIVNDYEVVVEGLNQMFSHYTDRIEVVRLIADKPVTDRVDIALYDSFAQGSSYAEGVSDLLRNDLIDNTVIYTWNLNPHVQYWAKQNGVAGCLSKELPARELVVALERIAAGERIHAAPVRGNSPVGGTWPGREEGLSYREGEMISLLTQGMTNAEIAEQLYLSPNSVKSYIRIAYRKIGVTRRTEAVAWGIAHGFATDRIRKKPPAA